MKAVSVARGLSFQFTHNINNLLRDLQKQGVKVPDAVSVARDLSVYAVETRYVGIEDPSQTKLKEAIRAARITLNWAKRKSPGRRPAPPSGSKGGGGTGR